MFSSGTPLRCYVSGAMTSSGNFMDNIKKAIDAGVAIQDAGHAPYIPHLNILVELSYPRPYEYWIEADLIWVGACNALVRLPGESKGADMEVARATLLGIPCFKSVQDFLDYAGVLVNNVGELK
jgi:uncharacterized protein DUF4406